MKSFFAKKIYAYALVFFAIPFISFAQTIELSFSPTSPSAGQAVTVSLRSIDVDLNKSDVTWYLDGSANKNGRGLKDFSFVLPDKTTSVRALIKEGGKNFEKFININPGQVDLLWEVVGAHKPPFYKGKALPVKTSFIKVTAFPQIQDAKGNITDAKNLTYSWQKDGSNMASQSGFGRNSITFPTDILDNSNSVSVSVGGGDVAKVRAVTIPRFNPSIHFYEYNNLYGALYNKALKNNQKISGRNINIIAEPYFINSELQSSVTTSAWKINDSIFTSPEKNIVFLNIAENINNLKVNVIFDKQGALLQKAERTINLSI